MTVALRIAVACSFLLGGVVTELGGSPRTILWIIAVASLAIGSLRQSHARA